MQEDLSVESNVDTRSDEELDKLAEDNQVARNSERPMTQEEARASEPQAAKAAEEVFEFVHNGKQVKGTRDQILKWAQMGFDRPQFQQRINQERQKWEQDKQQWESKWGIYRKIDEHAAQDPAWWKHVEEGWRNRGTFQPAVEGSGQSGAPTYTPDPRYELLERKLSQLEPVVNEFTQERQRLHEQAEDTKLDTEIQSMREQYKHLDWDTLDENGKHLEVRIMEHAQKEGISTFRAALRDLLHDDLVAKAASQGKLAVSQGIRNQSKLGVLGQSPTPTKGVVPQNRKPIRNTSYEELAEDIKDEIRRGVYK